MPYKDREKQREAVRLWHEAAIARRSTMRKARVALARRLAIIMHAMLRNETEFAPGLGHQSTRQETASSSRKERRPREGADGGADCVACGQPMTDCDFNLAALHPATPLSAGERAENTGIPRLDPLENGIGHKRS
jgi:hypothetical protein